MTLSTFVACAVALIFIGLLPKIFFKREGKFNLRWVLTALPFCIAAAGMVLYKIGWAPGVLPVAAGVYAVLEIAAVILSITSSCLIAFTLGTHRQPLALWHQDNDAPAEIVTWGAYARIRHPFYTAFILALLAVVLAAPHALSAFALIYGYTALHIAAVREEGRLCESQFGEAYRDYMKSTGRFFPKVGQ